MGIKSSKRRHNRQQHPDSESSPGEKAAGLKPPAKNVEHIYRDRYSDEQLVIRLTTHQQTLCWFAEQVPLRVINA